MFVTKLGEALVLFFPLQLLVPHHLTATALVRAAVIVGEVELHEPVVVELLGEYLKIPIYRTIESDFGVDEHVTSLKRRGSSTTKSLTLRRGFITMERGIMSQC